MNATTTYSRGTATHKVTSASVQPGTVLLTFAAGDRVTVATTKTGAELRTVASTERIAPVYNERVRRVVVRFTDGTQSIGQAPSQTWMALTNGMPVPYFAAPAAEVAPLEVVTLDGEETTVEVTATPKPVSAAAAVRDEVTETVSETVAEEPAPAVEQDEPVGAHRFARMANDAKVCVVCGKTRNAKAHKGAPVAADADPAALPEVGSARMLSADENDALADLAASIQSPAQFESAVLGILSGVVKVPAVGRATVAAVSPAAAKGVTRREDGAVVLASGLVEGSPEANAAEAAEAERLERKMAEQAPAAPVAEKAKAVRFHGRVHRLLLGAPSLHAASPVAPVLGRLAEAKTLTDGGRSITTTADERAALRDFVSGWLTVEEAATEPTLTVTDRNSLHAFLRSAWMTA